MMVPAGRFAGRGTYPSGNPLLAGQFRSPGAPGGVSNSFQGMPPVAFQSCRRALGAPPSVRSSAGSPALTASPSPPNGRVATWGRFPGYMTEGVARIWRVDQVLGVLDISNASADWIYGSLEYLSANALAEVFPAVYELVDAFLAGEIVHPVEKAIPTVSEPLTEAGTWRGLSIRALPRRRLIHGLAGSEHPVKP